MKLTEFNQLTKAQAYAALETCCAAPNWINAMLAARPFNNLTELQAQASRIWQSLKADDYLAAFEAHPQIGNVASLKAKFANTSAIAGHEQSGMRQANEQIIETMAELNQSYLTKFGFIFIVFASGKTAAQMLEILQSRMGHDRAIEIEIAAQEQAKITALRLNKLLEEAA
ncbi:2-oxo-4-hydroxy-4-carboxy-5-ureidoimidazoline decarboxylase [Catenovulum sp. 2E275]|uniref:2-oxo-4-hydroxy-4-carboxy-5-ureidoimidazoline decarboxylase n=1 Tax=Catenovulum sp. 2E275 TaxID=2980497 RepID=UPI0021D24B00|nr:2-oxo-4-hydroxy-4-carboxy-5-ureidoimidazoline decarboxylase [Catenovulum sp. 2E275]MCU4676030.1 2-oxo-4-hydroxy-4-carboxy-5-ureidoimidazoline decarboxylase [Catenovulum sp. 2E275]